MESSFSFVDMWHKMGFLAKGVVIILAIMSVYSITVMIERLVTFLRARGRSLDFVLSLGAMLKARTVAGALKLAKTEPQPPIARVGAAALDEYNEGLAALKTKGPADVG